MRILTYKRTHTGDPGENGIFGERDCMGFIRNWNYDAVVGIGVLNPWAGDEGISGKVTWVGVGPVRIKNEGRGDTIKFEQFVLLDEKGPDFAKLAPNLAERFYKRNARTILHSYSKVEKDEVIRLIKSIMASDQYQKVQHSSEPHKDYKDRKRCKKHRCAKLLSCK